MRRLRLWVRDARQIRAGRHAISKGLKAGLLAAACVLGCLAVPLALGGVAAVSGALAGEAWLLAGLAVAAIVVAVAVVRQRSTGKIC